MLKNNINKIPGKVKLLYYEFIDEFRMHNDKAIPVNFCTTNNNWGDLIGVEIVKKITGRKAKRCTTGKEKLFTVGSVLQKTNNKSLVWGSGFISQESKIYQKPKIVSALRGRLSLERMNVLLEPMSQKIPLGDPVLLLKYLQLIDIKHVNKTYKIGVIPHYSEFNTASQNLDEDILIIDITTSSEELYRQIQKCEVIFSSSLHGLILADVLEIKNLWISFAEKNLIGDFKFHDYYSTTDNKYPICTRVENKYDLIAGLRFARINKYIGDITALMDAFPIKELK